MKRGFKTHAERLAVEIRSRIGLDAEARLDLAALRGHLEVDLIELSALRDRCADAVDHLHGDGQADFSAALLVGSEGQLIVINDSHSRARLANSIAHELAHLLLGHEPQPGFDPLGNRHWPADDEEEADWLAGCLLAPRAGLIAVVTRLELDLDRAADHYGISIELMRRRWHQTGAARQLERARRPR